MDLFEANLRLRVYKCLLKVLADYQKKYPATGLDVYLEILLDKGVNVIPKDTRAQLILDHIALMEDEVGCDGVVQHLINTRFSDLPMEIRPTYKDGRRVKVAFWYRGDRVYDRAKDLFTHDGDGRWTDMEGKKVTLLDMRKEDKE